MPSVFDERENDVIRQCLIAVLDGPFIDDWEFETRLGFDRPTLREILSAHDQSGYKPKYPELSLAVNNCMNEIANGVTISPEKWARWFTVPKQMVESTLLKWNAIKS